MNPKIIDIRPYLTDPEAPEISVGKTERVFAAVSQCIESAASIAIAACVCLCTVVFLTLL